MESKKIKESRVITTTANLLSTDSEDIIFMEAESDDQVISLPKDLIPGLSYTFIHSNASGASTCRITPTNSKIIGYVNQHEGGNADATTADGLVSVLDGADGKYIQLTKATGHQGDFIKLICNGSDWYVAGGLGIFTHES
tara:strand:- start:44 stop:463 length:420 start_codon:yes stop_codon:yes gene_type:complete